MGDMPRWEKLLKDVREGKYKKFVRGIEKASCANKLDIIKSGKEMIGNGEKKQFSDRGA